MITAEQVRDMTWQEVEGMISGARELVHRGLIRIGQGTTRDVAAETGIALLTVRPRMTELLDLGLVRCVGRCRDGGIYAPVPLADAERAHRARHEAPVQVEMQLDLEGKS